MSIFRRIRSVLVNENNNALGVDLSTRSVQTIDYEHHEVHSGRHYNLDGHVCLDIGDEYWFTVSTCDTKRYAHMLYTLTTGGITCVSFLEDAVIDCGTIYTPVNNNRNSSNTSCHEFRMGSCAPTDYCTVLADSKVGSTQFKQDSGGGIGRGDELMLRCSTVYAVGVQSYSDNNRISFHASWYEHTDKAD